MILTYWQQQGLMTKRNIKSHSKDYQVVKSIYAHEKMNANGTGCLGYDATNIAMHGTLHSS